jgi:hypothetical protein
MEVTQVDEAGERGDKKGEDGEAEEEAAADFDEVGDFAARFVGKWDIGVAAAFALGHGNAPREHEAETKIEDEKKRGALRQQ